ncbi:uncharacterized protein [Arachis hypogaea]|uniref:uncharacterized protein isoform X2 n=1 Tax=Arachis hypogaea TaxID=3818 RepID=UPI000DEC939F
MVKIIDSDGTMKLTKLSVREAIEWPNGRRIVLKFNSKSNQLETKLDCWDLTMENFLSARKVGVRLPLKTRFITNVSRELIESIGDGSLTITPKLRQRRSAGKKANNRSKQLYTHTGGSKCFARRMEENSEQQGMGVGRGELWITVHKKKDGSYIIDEERIEEIEQQDESSRVLSQNDSMALVFGKEKPGRVRGVGFTPTPSQLYLRSEFTCAGQ